MLLKLKRIKRQSKYQPMNEGHEAGSDAIKVKKNKKADFKTLNIHSAIQWEREREREREIEKPWGVEGGPDCRSRSGEATSQRTTADLQWLIYRWRLQISDRAPEQRPISDLRWGASVDGDDERVAASRRRDRGFAGVWFLFVYWRFLFFFSR